MGTAADKLARLNETKVLLKTRLTEKGLDVAAENNFHNLADKVGEISSGGEMVNVEHASLGIGRVTFYYYDNGVQIKKLESFSVSVPKGTFFFATTSTGFSLDPPSGTNLVYDSDDKFYRYFLFVAVGNA